MVRRSQQQKRAKGRAAQKKRRKAERVANLPQPALIGALKLREACVYLGGIHPATMRRLVDRGLIRPNRLTRYLLFPIVELDRALHEGIVE
jgi:hypothetical protein